MLKVCTFYPGLVKMFKSLCLRLTLIARFTNSGINSIVISFGLWTGLCDGKVLGLFWVEGTMDQYVYNYIYNEFIEEGMAYCQEYCNTTAALVHARRS